jgi:hypothetical protein
MAKRVVACGVRSPYHRRVTMRGLDREVRMTGVPNPGARSA